MPHKITFEYAPGDSVVFMKDNKVQNGEISMITSFATVDEPTGEVKYTISYTDSKGAKHHEKRDSNEVFKTKKKLLASL